MRNNPSQFSYLPSESAIGEVEIISNNRKRERDDNVNSNEEHFEGALNALMSIKKKNATLIGDIGASGILQKTVLASRSLCCKEGCKNISSKKSFFCYSHSSIRQCEVNGCTKCAQGSTPFCIAHGGGRRCTFPGCDKGARDKIHCAAHGGGRRCTTEGCNRSAIGGSQFCTSHGGGKKCFHEGCSKSAQSPTAYCVKHGGGRSCQVQGCAKVARGRTFFCASHGGGTRCAVHQCGRAALSKHNLCRTHNDAKKLGENLNLNPLPVHRSDFSNGYVSDSCESDMSSLSNFVSTCPGEVEPSLMNGDLQLCTFISTCPSLESGKSESSHAKEQKNNDLQTTIPSPSSQPISESTYLGPSISEIASLRLPLPPLPPLPLFCLRETDKCSPSQPGLPLAIPPQYDHAALTGIPPVDDCTSMTESYNILAMAAFQSYMNNLMQIQQHFLVNSLRSDKQPIAPNCFPFTSMSQSQKASFTTRLSTDPKKNLSPGHSPFIPSSVPSAI